MHSTGKTGTGICKGRKCGVGRCCPSIGQVFFVVVLLNDGVIVLGVLVTLGVIVLKKNSGQQTV